MWFNVAAEREATVQALLAMGVRPGGDGGARSAARTEGEVVLEGVPAQSILKIFEDPGSFAFLHKSS